MGKGGFCLDVIGISTNLVPKPAPTALNCLRRDTKKENKKRDRLIGCISIIGGFGRVLFEGYRCFLKFIA